MDAGPAEMTSARGSHSVPSTLHASLMARLDRIGPAAKELARIGSAIGREIFCHEALPPGSPAGPRLELKKRSAIWSMRVTDFQRGCNTAVEFPVQARASAGCGLQHAAARLRHRRLRMRVLPARSRRFFPNSSKASRKSLRDIGPRPAQGNKPPSSGGASSSETGAAPFSGHRSAGSTFQARSGSGRDA